MTKIGILGEPSDVAAAVALLVSDDVHWITGNTSVQAEASSKPANMLFSDICFAVAIV